MQTRAAALPELDASRQQYIPSPRRRAHDGKLLIVRSCETGSELGDPVLELRSRTDRLRLVAGRSRNLRTAGTIGVPRDWHASASFKPRTGIAFAGGYVGDGLSTTNLAGRTLTALMTGTDPSLVAPGSDLRTLPWVNHLSPRWEPEPLRFFGSNLGLASADLADREERLTGRPSRVARMLGPLTGH